MENAYFNILVKTNFEALKWSTLSWKQQVLR